jgi:hypothetical protein
MPGTDAYVLLEPVKTPDNLYYSSNYFSMTDEQKAIVKQFPTIVDSVGYSDVDVLSSALTDLDVDGIQNLIIYRIDITEGGVVGDGNDFINIFYRFGNEIVDSYPIYKQGVR